MREFLIELKRRRVYRVALGYAAGSFIVLQGAELVLPNIGAPGWVLRVLVAAVLLGFPMALILAWTFDVTPEGIRKTARRAKSTPADGMVEPSVAVLAFEDMSPEHDQEHFCDGVAEEIIDALTRLPGLKVAARTSAFSFKGRNEDVRAIATKLGVAHVLEGSVRKAGSRLRVTVQLINAQDGYHLWSEQYHRELPDVFAIQEEIARSVAERLQLNFAPNRRPVARHSQNLEAYNLYLKGRFFWNKREGGLLRAREFFQEAVLADPSYTLAYCGLADCSSLLGFWGFESPSQAFNTARSHAQKALALDPELGEAYASLAFVQMMFDWDWVAAEANFRKALSIAPGYATTHHWYSELLVGLGRFEEGIAEAERARELDPLGPIINTVVALAYYYSRNYRAAIDAARRTLELDKTFVPAMYWHALSLDALGRHVEAIAIADQMCQLTEQRASLVSLRAYLQAHAGETEAARRALVDLQQQRTAHYISAFDLARIQAALGDHAAALTELEQAHEEHAAFLVWVAVDPALDPLHSTAPFNALCARMRLPVATRV